MYGSLEPAIRWKKNPQCKQNRFRLVPAASGGGSALTGDFLPGSVILAVVLLAFVQRHLGVVDEQSTSRASRQVGLLISASASVPADRQVLQRTSYRERASVLGQMLTDDENDRSGKMLTVQYKISNPQGLCQRRPKPEGSGLPGAGEPEKRFLQVAGHVHPPWTDPFTRSVMSRYRGARAPATPFRRPVHVTR